MAYMAELMFDMWGISVWIPAPQCSCVLLPHGFLSNNRLPNTQVHMAKLSMDSRGRMPCPGPLSLELCVAQMKQRIKLLFYGELPGIFPQGEIFAAQGILVGDTGPLSPQHASISLFQDLLSRWF